MKTNAFLHPLTRALTLAGASALILSGALRAADSGKAKEPAYENYIDFSGGYSLQTGDRPGFQKAYQLNKQGFGGVQDLLYSSQLNDTTALKLRGHALAGNADYLLDLTLTKDDVGYLKFGYKSYRVWFDGSGGYFPPSDTIITLYDEDLHIDRANLWLEAAYTKPESLNFLFRYDYLTRKGEKDSTSWMDTGLAISASATRNIVPTFLTIDEKRHILNASLSRTAEKNDWALGVRYDKGEYSNGRYSHRRPFEATSDRYVTAKEGQDYDMFQMRGLYASQLTEQIKLTTAVARTKIDTTLSGSRINGATYDADYTTNYPTRQQRDEGFLMLPGHELGDAEMTQTVATISALYLATEHLRITPALRFEKMEWGSLVEYEETNVGAGPSFAPIVEEMEAESEKSWKTYSGSVDARYTGIKNVALNLRAEMSDSTGDLMELLLAEPGTPLESISIDRDTELDRATQKYAFTTNWYARPGTTIAVQYYFKARQNDYDAVRDNTVSTSDRYPAYIANQDLETNDFNIRLSWRFSPNFRTITRYDYQKTTITTQDIGLAFKESMNATAHVLSEAVTWNPLPRWYLQGSVNLVWDTLTTPAVDVGGAALNVVKDSDANYTNFGLSSGYAIDDQSDVYVDYNYYKSRDSYVDNSAVSVPFGAASTMQLVSVAWNRRLDRRTTLTLKYTYAKNEDLPSGGNADYKASLLYGKIQYRF